MGPTSLTLMCLLGLVAATLLGGTVWVWPHLAGRGVRPVLGRVGLLAVSQVALMLVLAVVVNRYYAFYTTWQDLLGTGRSHVTLHAPVGRDPDTPVNLVSVKGTRKVGVPGDGDPARAGQILTVSVTGRRSGLSAPAFVYLPPQYFQPQYAQQRFPVVVVLTGYPGEATNLLTRLHLPKTAFQEMSAGRVQPTVYVMMRPTVVPGRDTECTDVPGGPQAATFFSQDLPEAVRGAYRIADGPHGWAMMGDSTGGYCAVKLAMLASDRIGAAVGLSTDYDAKQDHDTGDLYGGSKSFRSSQDLIWRLRNLPSPPVSVLVTSSKHGEGNYPATQEFVRLAKPPMRADSLILDSGGHNFRTWTTLLPDALRWLSDRQRQPAAAGATPPAPSPGLPSTPGTAQAVPATRPSRH